MKKILVIITSIILLVTAYFIFACNDKGHLPDSQKPRVLFTDAHPFHSGGLFSFVVSIVSSDLNKQFDFAVAAPETSDIYLACQKLGITTYNCTFPGGIKELPQAYSESKNFRKILNEFSPDIIHSNASHDRTMAVWNSLLLSKRPSIIQTFHWTKVISKDPYHWLFYNKLIDANMFISYSAAKINTEEKGLKLSNAYVIENSIDLEKFKPTPKNLGLQEQLGIPKDYFIFGSNAGLADYKRVDLMLDTLTLFPPDSKFRVIVLGRDPQPWIEKAKSMGVDHFLIFPGFHEDVRDFCSLFDVGFILSTRVETSSFASREMLAMGIPLISSYYSGLKDNVDNHVNGIFVEPGNIQDIYNAMNVFLNMPASDLQEYRKNARLKTERSFNAKDQLQAIANLYQDLLERKTSKVSSSSSIQSTTAMVTKEA